MGGPGRLGQAAMNLSDVGKERIEAEERHREAVRKKIKRKRGLSKTIAGLGGVLSLVFLVNWCVNTIGQPQTPEQVAIQKAERRARICKDPSFAFVMTQQFVKQRLKAPATAEFPGYHEITVRYLGDCTHLVTAWVDAHNAFGALIRKPYRARIKHTGEYNYRLIDLNM